MAVLPPIAHWTPLPVLCVVDLDPWGSEGEVEGTSASPAEPPAHDVVCPRPESCPAWMSVWTAPGAQPRSRSQVRPALC